MGQLTRDGWADDCDIELLPVAVPSALSAAVVALHRVVCTWSHDRSLSVTCSQITALLCSHRSTLAAVALRKSFGVRTADRRLRNPDCVIEQALPGILSWPIREIQHPTACSSLLVEILGDG